MRGAVMCGPGDVRVEEREEPRIVERTDAIIRVSAAADAYRAMDRRDAIKVLRRFPPLPLRYVERGRLGGSPANGGRVWPLLAVLVLGVGGCRGGAAGGSVEAEESRVSSDAGEVRCGRPFRLPAPAGLRLVARFTESVPAGQRMLSGTVEVTSPKAMRGVAPAAADVFLVREDRVVTTPLAQDAIGIRWELSAGETRTVPALASLVSCEPDGGPLPPGGYELYARLVVTADDGAAQRAFGGPWRLHVR